MRDSPRAPASSSSSSSSPRPRGAVRANGAATPSASSDPPDRRTESVPLTSADLRRWIDDRGGGAELIRCDGALTPDVASSAAALGVPVDRVVKSLLFACDDRFVVVVTNGETRVDAKKLARRFGCANRRVRLATPEETVRRTGFAPGTVPPFGHRDSTLPVLVDAAVPTLPGGGFVYGGGGDVDVEVRVAVDELVSLTNGELLDVKREEPAPAPPARAASPLWESMDGRGEQSEQSEEQHPKTTRAAASSSSPARVPVDRARSRYDERYGPESHPVSPSVASVMGKPWRAAAAEAAADPTLVRVVAEVRRVRRVAKRLAFANVRPLETPTRVAPDAVDLAQRAEARADAGVLSDDAGTILLDAGTEESGRMFFSGGDDPAGSSRVVPVVGAPVHLGAGTNLQLIVGRSLGARLRDPEAGAEATIDRLRKRGGVVVAEGRLQENPRATTVDLVCRTLEWVEGEDALELLRDAPDEEDEAEKLLPLPPHREVTETSRGEPAAASSSFRYASRAEREEAWGVGPGAVVDAAREDDAAAAARAFARLRVGEREGPMRRFPALPDEKIHWVDDAAGLTFALETIRSGGGVEGGDVEGGGVDRKRRTSTRGSYRVVGLDCEWRPSASSPVALVQAATRDAVFLIDALKLAESPESLAALDAFLGAVFADASLVKLGFGFAHDLRRLRRGYPTLRSAGGDAASAAARVSMVDARQAALVAFPHKARGIRRAGLAVLSASVLGAYVDKTEQCSDWARRPLTPSQIAYAAADAHLLTVAFDRCVAEAPDAIEAALRDPERPLEGGGGRTPGASDDDDEVEETTGGRRRKRGGGGGGGGADAPTRAATRAPTRTPRPPPGPPMRVSDVVRAVGRSFESRKAVADALDGYPANGGGSGGGRGGVETRGDFVVVFVNVGDGKGRRYGNEFWEEESSGRRRHRSEADADADGGDVDAEDVGNAEDVGVSSSAGTSSSAAVMMSWFSGTRADGAPRSVAEILRASREADAAEAEDAAEADEGEPGPRANENENKTKTAVLFLRVGRGGPYVCCGRLVAAGIRAGGEGGAGTRIDFRLADADRLRASGAFRDAVGRFLRAPGGEGVSVGAGRG